MNGHEELLERLTARRIAALGDLSPGAKEELVRAVRKNPTAFVDGAEDVAFSRLVEALDRHALAKGAADLIDDDDEYLAARTTRMRRLAQDCQDALAIDERCLDAALVAALAADREPDDTLEALLALRRDFPMPDGTAHAWGQIRLRAQLRLQAAIARTCLETARYRMAIETCDQLMRWDADDHLGARRTYALAYARLEDEPAFEVLDQRFGRQGDTWLHLARVILLFKLGRNDDARRALVGYSQLVAGGAYALLRPIMVDTYLPDRPDASPLGYDEANMAVWEAEPIIADTPDLPAWAADQPAVSESAWTFADRYGLEW